MRGHCPYKSDERFDQFDLWFGSPANDTAAYWWRRTARSRPCARVRERFAHCEQRDPLPVYAGSSTIVTFHFYLCRGYRGTNTAPASP